MRQTWLAKPSPRDSFTLRFALGKSTGARNFFGKHAPEVELLPARQPNKLRWPED